MGNVDLSNIFITQRLNDKLSKIGTYPITTIIAPMGYGKTTSIRWWSTRRTKSNESALFLRQMIITDSVTDFWQGFCRVFREFPELYDQLIALPYPKDLKTLSMCSYILNEALSDYKKDIYYILDDIHILHPKAITPLVLFFSKNLAPNAHIILLSRNQIFTEKEKMQLGHQLGEITAFDLRLNRKELD